MFGRQRQMSAVMVEMLAFINGLGKIHWEKYWRCQPINQSLHRWNWFQLCKLEIVRSLWMLGTFMSGGSKCTLFWIYIILYLWWVEVAGSLLQDISGIYPYIKNPFHWDFLESKLKSISNHRYIDWHGRKSKKTPQVLNSGLLRFTLYILYIHSKLDFYRHHRVPERNPGHLWQRHHVPERDSAPTARKKESLGWASGEWYIRKRVPQSWWVAKLHDRPYDLKKWLIDSRTARMFYIDGH